MVPGGMDEVCDIKVKVDDIARKLWRLSILLRVAAETSDELHQLLVYELGRLKRLSGDNPSAELQS